MSAVGTAVIAAQRADRAGRGRSFAAAGPVDGGRLAVMLTAAAPVLAAAELAAQQRRLLRAALAASRECGACPAAHAVIAAIVEAEGAPDAG